jgi:hypothetical protein
VGGDSDEDEGEDVDEIVGVAGGRTFQETLDEEIDLIVNFAQGLRYQAQFRDQRLLNALERNGAGFFRMARACLDKENRMRTGRGGEQVSTWEKSTITAMFYRSRPKDSDEA